MEKLVFDPKLWGGKDKGDNSQFWKPATILREYTTTRSPWGPGGEAVADVLFHHDGRVSCGHFTQSMKELL